MRAASLSKNFNPTIEGVRPSGFPASLTEWGRALLRGTDRHDRRSQNVTQPWLAPNKFPLNLQPPDFDTREMICSPTEVSDDNRQIAAPVATGTPANSRAALPTRWELPGYRLLDLTSRACALQPFSCGAQR
jgi:hypothetical protein